MEIFCQKLKKNAAPLPKAPVKGELGERILLNISKEAWISWLQHQTMLINENALNMGKSSDRDFLLVECEKFFFEEGSELPEGYTAPIKNT